MSPSILPLVSIGLPVFNGEKGLARALDSLVGQDYENLEIIVSDNGSTDATSVICAEYSSKDPRVRYYKSEKNQGSSWNFNRVFELSSGKYFMWAAHDDDRHPSFVSACVEKLEKCPDAVLCQARTSAHIEGNERLLYTATLFSFEDKVSLLARYRETLKSFPATALYGVYRSSAMRKTKLFRKSVATDMAFAQELSIYGRFVHVPSVLFTYWGRANWNSINDDYRTFFNGDRKPWWYIPFIFLFLDHWQRVGDADIPLSSKLILWIALVLHEARQLSIKILTRSSAKLCPRRWKKNVGIAIYKWCFLSINIIVADHELFFERVIRPQLRWY